MTTTVCTTAMNRKGKLQALMAQMSDGLLEREHQVRLMMFAALSGEHVLLRPLLLFMALMVEIIMWWNGLIAMQANTVKN